ncbi:MAG: PASTA domain-containing protein, partial [Candidatus Firestonebacteria bacterium]|nr:PASTA domain-containing protein [Candidatus Firestonebacteria bacterium]
PETARRLRALLAEVVEHGTGTEAQIPGYTVAGKTGTAQKPVHGGRGYDLNRHVASFVGFLPADNPRLLMAVIIDSPHDVSWGGVVAGPVFKAMGQNLVAYLGITPAQPQWAVPEGTKSDLSAYVPADALSVPDIVGSQRGVVEEQLKRQGLTAVGLGQGTRVLAQRPEPGAQVKPGSPVMLYFDPEKESAAQAAVAVPNVAGQSLRNALQLLGVYGLRAQVKGSGVVCAQSPLPNAMLQLGSVCNLTCADPEVHP